MKRCKGCLEEVESCDCAFCQYEIGHGKPHSWRHSDKERWSTAGRDERDCKFLLKSEQTYEALE